MKRNTRLFFVAFISLTIVISYGCSKSGNKNNGGNNGGTNNGIPAAGTGKFTFQGTIYGNECIGGVDNGSMNLIVGIADTVINGQSTFGMTNVPTATSGTYNFTDGYVSDSSSTLAGVVHIGYFNGYNYGKEYYTKSGTLTKTGAKSFNFSCVVYDYYTNETYNVTGSGSYKLQ